MKMKVRHTIIALVGAAILACVMTSCGTMTNDDWYNVGYTIGSYLAN